MGTAHDPHLCRADRRPRRIVWALVCPWLLACSACGDPCRDLSEKICSCMATLEARQSCNSRVGTLASQFNTDAQSPSYVPQQAAAAATKKCAQLLETCTCQALQKGDLQACGLANEPAGL